MRSSAIFLLLFANPGICPFSRIQIRRFFSGSAFYLSQPIFVNDIFPIAKHIGELNL
jgi:hypothetical protein